MPKYDFKCEECEHHFEALITLQKMKEIKCLKCGSPKTQKMLSAPAIILKGQGFYKTDSQKASSSSCSGTNCSKSSNQT